MPPAIPDCTAKALELARVISPEKRGQDPGCPLSSFYQPYSITQTHHSDAKFGLLREVLRRSPWSVAECEAPSWPENPPCISASFLPAPSISSLPHLASPFQLRSRLGPLRLCCSLCFGPTALPSSTLTSWLLVPPTAGQWSWPQGTASPCGGAWHCTPWESLFSRLYTSWSNSGAGATAASSGSPAPGTRSGITLETVNMSEWWEKEDFATVLGNQECPPVLCGM